MKKSHTITVRSKSDVIIARMRVRESARMVGLGIRDQACIALATSSLAYAMRLGGANEGYIDVYCSDIGERVGVQVVCIAGHDVELDLESKAFVDARWMVDELTIEEPVAEEARIVLVKWAA